MICNWQLPWLIHQVVLMELVPMRAVRRKQTVNGNNDPERKFAALPSGRRTTPAFNAGDRSSPRSRHGERRPVERGAGERSEYLSA